jgi:hypothetical protein
MGKPVSTAQSHAVIAALQTNVDWKNVDSDAAQFFISKPHRAGDLFTEFLRKAMYNTGYLYPLSTTPLYLRETEGNALITENEKKFPLGVDPIFREFPFKYKMGGTAAARILPHMLMENAVGRQIFHLHASKSVSLTQDQVLAFMESGSEWLTRETKHLFLCMMAGETFIICIATGPCGRSAISARKLDDEKYGYSAGCRVLLPIM